MDFCLTDEQGMWNDTGQDFMVRDVGQEYTLAHDLSREFPEEVCCKMADLGWLGLLAPEDQGGMATDPVMVAIFCEAIGKYGLDTAACIMTAMFAVTDNCRHGTPEQIERHLPPFLHGEAKHGMVARGRERDPARSAREMRDSSRPLSASQEDARHRRHPAGG